MRHFHFVVPVWGASYTSLFADVCLPLLMTSGNLGAIRGGEGNRFVIATTYADARYLSAHPSLARLKEFVEVEYQLIDGLANTRATHEAMSYCYSAAMKSLRVKPGYTYFVFLTPDSFWSEGTFQRLKSLADEGYSVAMVMGLRTNSESIVPELKKLIRDKADNPSMPIEALVTLSLRHLHQMSRAHDFLSGDRFLNQWPSHLYWWGGRDRLIARCFHMHPLMVQSKASVSRIGDSIDGEFLDNLNYPLDKYFIARGNEDFLGIELSSSGRSWGMPLSPPSAWMVALFGVWHANSRHWHFFRHEIVYSGQSHTPDPLDSLLDDLIKQVIKRVRLGRIPSIVLSKLGIKKIMYLAVKSRIGQAMLVGKPGKAIRYLAK